MTRYDLDREDQVDEATALEMERREQYWNRYAWTGLFYAICAWVAEAFRRRCTASYVFYVLVLIACVWIGIFVHRYGSYRISHPPQRELPTPEQLLKLDHEK